MERLYNEKVKPGMQPEVEFNIVHTTGISEEVFQWLVTHLGPSLKGRWFIINRSIYFKHERDYIWFSLAWP